MEKLKVLVIDDEPGIRSGVIRILKNYKVSYPFMDNDVSYTILEAHTGEDGIALIISDSPDIILLDNKLPGIQGTEVMEYIRNNNIDCKVAMITSYPSLEVAIKATDDGASDFLPKPFTPDELKASISTITKQLFLRRITQKLKKVGKEVRFQFLSVLSHELKSPLNAISGYLNIMKEKQLGENVEDYNQVIERALARAEGMKTLIMDLLDLTKIKLKRESNELKVLDLNDIAKYAVDTIRPYAIQREISLQVQADKKNKYTANKEDMEIIFNNIISNAVKYNIDGGSVVIELKTDADNVYIIITDTGIGISEEEKSNLFQDFVRIKNEKTKYIVGSGLGLSIVKKILAIYNGDISIESTINKGSTFTIKLPYKQ